VNKMGKTLPIFKFMDRIGITQLGMDFIVVCSGGNLYETREKTV